MAFKLPGFNALSIESLVYVSTGGLTAGTTVSMNSATGAWGCLFMASVSESMVGCVFQAGANTGTPSSTIVNLYAVDANGYPTGASLATATFTPTSNVVNTVTFAAAYTVTSGVVYALIFTNATATPASNFAQIRTIPMWSNNWYMASSDSGSTYTLSGISSLCCAPQYTSTGVIASCQYNGFGAGTSVSLYNTAGSRIARCAMKCVFEMDVLLWYSSFAMNARTGSPNYSISGEVCSSSAVLSTSDSAYPSATVTGTTVHYWSTPYRLLAGTEYYIGITSTTDGNGSAGNCYNPTNALTLLNPATVGPFVSAYTSTGTTPSWTISSKPLSMFMALEIPKAQQYFYAGMRGGFNG